MCLLATSETDFKCMRAALVWLVGVETYSCSAAREKTIEMRREEVGGVKLKAGEKSSLRNLTKKS